MIIQQKLFGACAPLSILGGPSETVPLGPPSIGNGAHGIKKLLLNTELKILQVNLPVYLNSPLMDLYETCSDETLGVLIL